MGLMLGHTVEDPRLDSLPNVRPFRLDDTEYLQENYTSCDPLGYFTPTHTKMISPDKSLHPMKLNNLLQLNKHNKITQYMNEIY